MPAGLASPLHLAASLLALTAAVGLAVVAVTARAGSPQRAAALPGAGLRPAAALLLALGAVVHAVGSGLSGALVATGTDLAAWLRAAGLVGVALGVAAPFPRSDDAAGLGAETASAPGLEAGPALLIPVASLEAAAVAAVAGAVAAARLAAAGRWRMVGISAALLGAAELLARVSALLGALATLAGALVLWAWLWRSSRTRLASRFVTAFVTTVLGVVVLLAVTLSSLGTADLVQDELVRLEDRSDSLAGQVGVEWPGEAVAAVAPLRASAASVLGAAGDTTPLDERVEDIYRAFFSTEQDLLVAFGGADGDRVGAASAAGDVSAELQRRLRDSASVTGVLSGAAETAGELLVVDERIYAIGATRLDGMSGAQGDPAGVLLAGRVVDEEWVAGAALTDTQVVVEAGTAASVASADVAAIAPQVLSALGPGATSQTVVVPGEADARFVAASPVRLPDSGAVGRVVTVSRARGVAALERDQARRLFVLALLGAGLAAVVAVAVSRRLVAPIQRLTTVAAAVREGRLDVSARVRSPDEVGTLGRTFDEMTASLADQSAQLREAATVQSRLRARLETLTASMGDALVAVDQAGTVLTVNPAAERLIGRPAADLLGHPLEQVLVGTGPSGLPAAEAVGAPASSEVVAVTLLLTRPDGRRLSVAATAAPVRDPGQAPAGRVLVLRDRTREAEIERMKAEFLSNVSHELRTPLTPIRGYAEVLARRDTPPDATRRFAEQILDSTGRLERVVRLIVDFAALDSGKLQLRREPIALPELVGDVVAEWRARTPGREFRRRLPSALPAVVADPSMLRRCLDELLDNAVKFSPGGGAISVTASLHRTDGAGPGVSHDVVRLSVRDRGVGMEQESAARAFSDFYQADATETRHFGGLGLGLALVRRIVDGLDGEVTVDSTPGEGTTVHLLLPVAEVGAAANGRWRPATATAGGGDRNGETDRSAARGRRPSAI